ncbi:hypothetical protein D3C86_1725820 [compost metagenome]
MIVAGVGDLAFRLGGVFLEVDNPGQAVAAFGHQYPADFLEQRGLLVGVDERMVDRHPRRQGAVEALDFLFRLGAPGLAAQGFDAECQVLGGFAEQLHFLRAEGVRFRCADANGAEDLALDP